jgi:hypothetical protein
VETGDGAQLFGRVITKSKDAVLVVPPEPGGRTTTLRRNEITALSPATALIRRL